MELTPEELQVQLKTLKDNLATETDAKAKAMMEKELKELQSKLPTAEQVKGLQGELAEMKKANAENQKALNELIKKSNDRPVDNAPQDFSTQGMLGKALNENIEKVKAFRANPQGGTGFVVDIKAVGNFASATSLTGSYFVPPTTVPGVLAKLYEETHLRDILPVGQTTSNVVRYIRDNGGEGAPGMVAEGGTKPQMDRDLQVYDAPVRKIAVYMRLPEEMVEDIPYLQSFLSQIGIEEVMIVEDAQILYGDGTGNNLSGLFTNATAFAAGTSVIGASANQYDVLRAARKQGRMAKHLPTVALVSPSDYYDLTSRKDTTNNYLFQGGGNGINLAPSIDGMRIVEHTAITIGDFLVLDPRSAAIFDRAGISVRFYDQDQDNAIKNLITIVIEKRLALPIYRTTGLIKGTFATGITDLTS